MGYESTLYGMGISHFNFVEEYPLREISLVIWFESSPFARSFDKFVIIGLLSSRSCNEVDNCLVHYFKGRFKSCSCKCKMILIALVQMDHSREYLI